MAHIKKMVVHGFKSFARKTEIPFDQGINVIIGANGSGKCITGESLVQMADGELIEIKDLVNEQVNGNVVAKTEDGWIAPGKGQEVMCLDMNDLKVKKRKIKAFVKKTSPKKILRIKTKSGREIKSTKYHPFFVMKDGKVVPAKAEELKKGIKIAVPRELNIETKDKYMIELLDLIKVEDNIYVPNKQEYVSILRSLKGSLRWKDLAKNLDLPYYAVKGLADGQSINMAHFIKICRAAGLEDNEIINLIPEFTSRGKKIKLPFINNSEFSRFLGYLLAEGRLSETSSQIWFTNGNAEVVRDFVRLSKKITGKNPSVKEYKPNCWDVIIYSEPLKKILSKLGMSSTTSRKFISNIILKHSGKEEIGNLLGGLYSGDGYIGNSCIEIVTKSKKLSKGIENCLLRLGIYPRTRKKVINKAEFQGEYWRTTSYGVNAFRKFYGLVNVVHDKKKWKIREGLNKKSNSNLDLMDVNGLIKKTVEEDNLNIKENKKTYPKLSCYCYNGCTPSRDGVATLLQEVLQGNGPSFKRLEKLAFSDIFWDELTDVEEIQGEKWVYDLTIEGDHNFVANNIFAHNSNVSDSLCFALGRLSIKSMRAAKAKNLLFMGSKSSKPAKEAYVELIFDNSDRAFATDKNEVSLKRVVKNNGQSTYIINGQKKTRSEVIELLAHAGIDPHGYNMVLQGQIQSIVKMHPEERRKIIEEVAGISIYESRKAKSLRELEKTDSKLKEVSAVLRERTAYLNNLDRERAQALRFKELEKTEKKCRASIITKRMREKDKELGKIRNSIQEKVNQRGKIKAKSDNMQKEIASLSEKIEEINKHIQKSTGLEQDKLHNDIANLKAELEGLRVRKESFETRKNDTKRRIEEVSKTIPELEAEIVQLREKSPLMAKKAEELKKKKEELALLGEERKKFLTIKSDLNSIRELVKDKQNQLGRVSADSENVLRQLESYSENLNYEGEEECSKSIELLKQELEDKRKLLIGIDKKEIENEKIISVSESEIERSNKIKLDVKEIDVCPLCQSKMTEEHLNHVFSSSDEKINSAKEALDKANKALEEAKNKKQKLNQEIKSVGERISSAEVELLNHKSLKEKKSRLKEIVENEKTLKADIVSLEERMKKLESKKSNLASIEEKYDSKILEIEEISSRTEEDVDTTILYKERELENTRNIIKRAKSDLEDIGLSLSELIESLENKGELLSKKEEAEEKLNEKFEKMFEERNSLQKQIQENNLRLSDIQNNIRQIEDQINYLKIGKAKIDAEKEALEMDMTEFEGVELLQGSINALEERLRKTKDSLARIGSINMRALEVYEEVKQEYDAVYGKVETLNKEKEDILSIIEEIDKKKRREFMKTYRAINQIFTDNFAKLYTKGVAYLELENKESIFEGGVNIVVKLAKGKYFDVTSLSGGEQTLVALSLLFAIQEHKPYHFYVFDEIDAALDKRNSERLAGLLKQYMQAGQYIVITHNDAIISDSNVLYGVSMHEGISKVLSLKVD